MAHNAVLMFYAAVSVIVFFTWGSLVRRGTLRNEGILWSGLVVGFLAVGASVATIWPLYASGRAPFLFVALNALMMIWVTAFCVWMLYRQQRVEDLAVYTVGDTKVIVRTASAHRLPDAHALLLPTLTNLRMADGLAVLVRVATGPAPEKELAKVGPVGIGKVVQTGGGLTPVSRIFHVAVADASRPTDAGRLRKGMETAAQQARKEHAESLAVPVGPLRGLPIETAAEAIIGGVLRQRKAFAEIVFVVLEARHAKAVTAVAQTVLAELDALPQPKPSGRAV